MVYLKSFKLLNSEEEMYMLSGDTRTYIKNTYPFLIFPNKKLENISFSDITIFYGNNVPNRLIEMSEYGCLDADPVSTW